MIVVDASVLVNVIADAGPDGRLARDRIAGVAPLHVPHLVDAEVLAALRRFDLVGSITPDEAVDALVDLVGLPLRRHPNWTLMARAWDFRHNFTAYDALYLALAERFDCTLVTADGPLSRAPNLPCDVELLAV